MNGVLSFIGIGSNMGDSLKQCKEAIDKLSHQRGIRLERVSSFYKTEPIYDSGPDASRIGEQNWYINAVAEIRTTLSPRHLLNAMMEIERIMGRRREFKGAPRTIDLDLLLYGQEIIEEEDLSVPHSRMHKRRFVLVPLCEIASYVIHPLYGVSMRGLKERLDDEKRVERLIV